MIDLLVLLNSTRLIFHLQMLTTVQLKHHVQNVVSKKMEEAEEVGKTSIVEQ